MLQLTDGRALRIASGSIAYYSPDPSGGTWLAPEGASDGGALLVTETPEQIDALIAAAQGGGFDSDLVGYVSLSPDGLSNWWPAGPHDTMENMFHNAKRDSLGTDRVYELRRGRVVVDTFVQAMVR